MSLPSLSHLFRFAKWLQFQGNRPSAPNRCGRASLVVESLETRCLLSTTLVKDINPGTADSNPTELTAINQTLYFQANDGTHGNELWKSDGTAAGTVLIKDINPGAGNGINVEPAGFVNLNGTLFFNATDGVDGLALWKSDGTAAGTVMVRSFGQTGQFDLGPVDLSAANGKLYFSVGTGPASDQGLWVSNGTTAGTTRISDAVINSDTVVGVNNAAYFLGRDAAHGFGLWKTNGTAAGTVFLKQLNFFDGQVEMAVVNGTIYFNAGTSSNTETLWKSNGTTAGTVIVAQSKLPNPYPHHLTPVGGELYFEASGTSGAQLWKTNGTTAGTVRIKDVSSVSGDPQDYGPYPVLGTTVLFNVNNGTSLQLWKTNGTTSGTVEVAPQSGNWFTLMNGNYYFAVQTGSTRNTDVSLWKTNGTTAGTVRVHDFGTTTGLLGLSYLAAANGTVFFAAPSTVYGRELWKSDGVPDGGAGPAGAPGGGGAALAEAVGQATSVVAVVGASAIPPSATAGRAAAAEASTPTALSLTTAADGAHTPSTVHDAATLWEMLAAPVDNLLVDAALSI